MVRQTASGAWEARFEWEGRPLPLGEQATQLEAAATSDAAKLLLAVELGEPLDGLELHRPAAVYTQHPLWRRLRPPACPSFQHACGLLARGLAAGFLLDSPAHPQPKGGIKAESHPKGELSSEDMGSIVELAALSALAELSGNQPSSSQDPGPAAGPPAGQHLHGMRAEQPRFEPQQRQQRQSQRERSQRQAGLPGAALAAQAAAAGAGAGQQPPQRARWMRYPAKDSQFATLISASMMRTRVVSLPAAVYAEGLGLLPKPGRAHTASVRMQPASGSGRGGGAGMQWPVFVSENGAARFSVPVEVTTSREMRQGDVLVVRPVRRGVAAYEIWPASSPQAQAFLAFAAAKAPAAAGQASVAAQAAAAPEATAAVAAFGSAKTQQAGEQGPLQGACHAAAPAADVYSPDEDCEEFEWASGADSGSEDEGEPAGISRRPPAKRQRKVAMKSSKHVGVHRLPGGRWRAMIHHNARSIWLGSYAMEDEAARAYDKAAIQIRGAAARTNLPVSKGTIQLWLAEEPSRPAVAAAAEGAQAAHTHALQEQKQHQHQHQYQQCSKPHKQRKQRAEPVAAQPDWGLFGGQAAATAAAAAVAQQHAAQHEQEQLVLLATVLQQCEGQAAAATTAGSASQKTAAEAEANAGQVEGPAAAAAGDEQQLQQMALQLAAWQQWQWRWQWQQQQLAAWQMWQRHQHQLQLAAASNLQLSAAAQAQAVAGMQAAGLMPVAQALPAAGPVPAPAAAPAESYMGGTMKEGQVAAGERQEDDF